MRFEPFEQQSNLQEDLGLFEAATHAHPVDLVLPSVERIHLAMDGTNQDATAREMAGALAAQLQATLHEQVGATSAADILAGIRDSRANMLVLPVPFGHDYQQLKSASLGPIVDMLLLAAECPVLCIRELMSADEVTRCLSDILAPVTAGDEYAQRALAWAFRLVRDRGSIEMLLAADRSTWDEASRLLHSAAGQAPVEPERMERALLQDLGGLISAAQHLGQQSAIGVHVETRAGQFVELATQQAERRSRLIVYGTPREHTAPQFHRCVDLILASSAPVLIV